MKRKALSLVLGLALIMASATTAMAAEAPQAAMTLSVTSVEASEYDNGDWAEIKEGLHVSLFEEKELNSEMGAEMSSGYCGVISQEDMETIIAGLDLDDAGAKALMDKFHTNKRIQEERAALFTDVTENTTQEEFAKIFEKDSELAEEEEELFVGDVLDKAVELELLTKATMGIFVVDAIEGEGGLDTMDVSYNLEAPEGSQNPVHTVSIQVKGAK